MDARAEGHVRLGAEQDDAALLVGCAEAQHLGHERPDLAWREVHDGDHMAPLELLAGVVRDLRRGALDADLRPEVDRQLPGRLARLGELVDLEHAPHAHVDREELVEGERHRRLPVSRPAWARASAPASARATAPAAARSGAAGASRRRPGCSWAWPSPTGPALRRARWRPASSWWWAAG